MCLSLQFLRNYFQSCTVGSQTNRRENKLNANSHSTSFKVTHFGITEKLTTDCMPLYNNVLLMSKVSEEIGSETLKIAVVDSPTVV